MSVNSVGRRAFLRWTRIVLGFTKKDTQLCVKDIPGSSFQYLEFNPILFHIFPGLSGNEDFFIKANHNEEEDYLEGR